MKKLLLAAIAMLATIGASAQSAQFGFWDGDQPENRLTWGVRIGTNFSSLHGDEEITDSKVGLKIGVSADINILNSFAISTGLFYSMQGYKPLGDNGLTAGYLNLPIYASYRLNFAEASMFQFNFGPYLACGLHGSDHYFDAYKRFDMGLGVGAGFTVNRWFLGVDYQFGLTNINDLDDDESLKNRNFSITLGYNF